MALKNNNLGFLLFKNNLEFLLQNLLQLLPNLNNIWALFLSKEIPIIPNKSIFRSEFENENAFPLQIATIKEIVCFQLAKVFWIIKMKTKQIKCNRQMVKDICSL